MSGDPVRRGRPEASAAVWDWRGDRDERASRAARLRRGGMVRAAVAAVAGGAFFFFDRPVVASVAWGVGGLTLVLALASPLGAYAAVERGVARVGEAVGAVLTWLLLAPVFYLFFAPFGLLFKRGRRDPMKRALERDAETYWEKREPARPLDRPY
ncbi:MAG TPA: hypothetical protein RMH99_24055 [Sandaracinaceae bacterium LLY-WYZ-13_1]|nr:hypothetical protein [Sandaracinaceae bacterium LLY-WYZ-13_1]